MRIGDAPQALNKPIFCLPKLEDLRSFPARSYRNTVINDEIGVGEVLSASSPLLAQEDP